MTIPILIAVNLFVGVSVAYSARIQIRTLQRSLFFNRYFAALIMLETMILIPIGIYFYIFYPDWSWMYLVDTSASNPGIGVMALSSYPTAAVMGYLVGYYSSRGNSDWVALALMVFVAVGIAGLFVTADEKLAWLGTYEQFRQNTGLKPIGETSLMPSVILASLSFLICWLYIAYRFWQEGRLSLRSF